MGIDHTWPCPLHHAPLAFCKCRTSQQLVNSKHHQFFAYTGKWWKLEFSRHSIKYGLILLELYSTCPGSWPAHKSYAMAMTSTPQSELLSCSCTSIIWTVSFVRLVNISVATTWRVEEFNSQYNTVQSGQPTLDTTNQWTCPTLIIWINLSKCRVSLARQPLHEGAGGRDYVEWAWKPLTSCSDGGWKPTKVGCKSK